MVRFSFFLKPLRGRVDFFALNFYAFDFTPFDLYRVDFYLFDSKRVDFLRFLLFSILTQLTFLYLTICDLAYCALIVMHFYFLRVDF